MQTSKTLLHRIKSYLNEVSAIIEKCPKKNKIVNTFYNNIISRQNMHNELSM